MLEALIARRAFLVGVGAQALEVAGLDALGVTATPTRKDAGHHAIRCCNLMRQDAYEGALNNLARAALARAVEADKPSFHHS